MVVTIPLGGLLFPLVVVLLGGVVTMPLGAGQDSGLAHNLLIGLVYGLFGTVFLGLLGFLIGLQSETVTADPPQRFARAAPNAVLTASRWNGLLSGLIAASAIGVLFGLPTGLVTGVGVGVVDGLVFGLGMGLVIGLPHGLNNGLDAWLYHYWLRRRCSTRGVLPARLPTFLEWCAEDERGWLRITNAYEFRHRQLLEHLASQTMPND